jgi:hypothetical protein
VIRRQGTGLTLKAETAHSAYRYSSRLCVTARLSCFSLG